MRIRFYAITTFLLTVYSGHCIAAITCPPMPNSVTEVNRDVKSDIRASAASLGMVKAGEVSTKTEVTVKNLFEKYPNVDKLMTLQTMVSTYCAMLRDSTTLNEKEKLDRWERFQEKVLNLQSDPAPIKQSPNKLKPEIGRQKQRIDDRTKTENKNLNGKLPGNTSATDIPNNNAIQPFSTKKKSLPAWNLSKSQVVASRWGISSKIPRMVSGPLTTKPLASRISTNSTMNYRSMKRVSATLQ